MTARSEGGPVVSTEDDRYQRMVASLIASWKRYAEGSVGALVRNECGATGATRRHEVVRVNVYVSSSTESTTWCVPHKDGGPRPPETRHD
jgi:hypothetical protein